MARSETLKELHRIQHGSSNSASTPNGIPAVHLPAGETMSWVTSAAMLADLLEPLIEQLGKELTFSDTGIPHHNGPVGALDSLSNTAGRILGSDPKTVVRRLRDIRTFTSRAVTTELADALLLAFDIHINETILPTFPVSKTAAHEQIDVWLDSNPEEHLTPEERETIVNSIISFTKGFLADNTTEPLPDTEQWAKEVARQRLRKTRLRVARGLEAFFKWAAFPQPEETLEEAA